MANDEPAPSARLRWARLRFQILGPLLAAPAETASSRRASTRSPGGHGDTRPPAKPSTSPSRRWSAGGTSPAGGRPARRARAQDPRPRGHPSELGLAIEEASFRSIGDHPRWSYQLHHDNVVALVRQDPTLGPVASYGTVCRFMKGQGLLRGRKHRQRRLRGASRSWHASRARTRHSRNGLWHLDFHQGRARSSPRRGKGKSRSSSACSTTARGSAATCSGIARRPRRLSPRLSQGFQKRGLPRSFLSDNGAAMSPPKPPKGSSDSASCST